MTLKTSTHRDTAYLPLYSSSFKELSHLLAQRSVMVFGLDIVSLFEQEPWKIKLGESSLGYWLLLFICSFLWPIQLHAVKMKINRIFFFFLFIFMLFQRIVLEDYGCRWITWNCCYSTTLDLQHWPCLTFCSNNTYLEHSKCWNIWETFIREIIQSLNL